MRSDVDSLPGNRLWYRAMVAYLHFIQPLARLRGRIRGALSPPSVALPTGRPQTSRGPRPSLAEAWRALLLISGTVIEDRYWSESWTSTESVLSLLTDWLRQSRAVHTIEIDDGWSDDRDISVFIGRWAWLDIRALVEEHDSGKTLLRVSTHLRPTSFGIVSALGLALTLLLGAVAGVALRWPISGALSAGLTLGLIAFTIWRTAQGTAIVRRAVDRVADGLQMVVLRSGPAGVPPIAPSLVRRYGLRSAFIFVVMIVGVGAGTLMLREAATVVLVIGPSTGAGSGALTPTISAWLDTPGGIAIATNGDIYFADSHNDVIDLLDRRSIVSRVIGNGTSGFSGDGGQAIRAQLDTPDGVAVAPDGDLIVADSHNDRIRRVDRPTRIITTIAGSGENGFDGDEQAGARSGAEHAERGLRDRQRRHLRRRHAEQPDPRHRCRDRSDSHRRRRRRHRRAADRSATAARRPARICSCRAMSPSPATATSTSPTCTTTGFGKVDARTGIIATVAGNGSFGNAGDDGPATAAQPGQSVGARAGRGPARRRDDDLHRRLLQRARPRRGTGRADPQRHRRGPAGARIAVAGRVRRGRATGSTSPTPATTRSSAIDIPKVSPRPRLVGRAFGPALKKGP